MELVYFIFHLFVMNQYFYVYEMSAMERILDENGFSPKVTLNKLKEARLLSTKDNYRCTAKMTINGVEQDVVIVYYKSD